MSKLELRYADNLSAPQDFSATVIAVSRQRYGEKSQPFIVLHVLISFSNFTGQIDMFGEKERFLCVSIDDPKGIAPAFFSTVEFLTENLVSGSCAFDQANEKYEFPSYLGTVMDSAAVDYPLDQIGCTGSVDRNYLPKELRAHFGLYYPDDGILTEFDYVQNAQYL